jgi:hypothetical protein
MNSDYCLSDETIKHTKTSLVFNMVIYITYRVCTRLDHELWRELSKIAFSHLTKDFTMKYVTFELRAIVVVGTGIQILSVLPAVTMVF